MSRKKTLLPWSIWAATSLECSNPQGGFLMSPQDDLHRRVRERGVVGKQRWFMVNVVKAFPSPHSSFVGRGRSRHAACSTCFVAYPEDLLVNRSVLYLSGMAGNRLSV